MRIQNLCWILLFCLIYTSCIHTKRKSDLNNTKTLKVLSWNIWHGGHVKAYGKKACDNTIGLLKESQADVIFMVETYGAAHQVADSLGYYHRLLSSNLSIYSKYPITETYTFPDSISAFHFGGVMIRKDGHKIRLFNTWLHYLPDCTLVPTGSSSQEIVAWDDKGTRDDEIKMILRQIAPFIQEAKQIPIIMAGDFNGHSHLDWTEAAKNVKYHNGATALWTVSREMQQVGFIDSYRELHPDVTKDIGATWIYGHDAQNQAKNDYTARIDYIYYQGNLQAISSNTFVKPLTQTLSYQGKDFFYPSDHGFVTTTFIVQK